jgi:hypothetical protein
MKNIIHETFENDWLSNWTGKAHNAYTTTSSHDGQSGLRILFRRGSHYGSDLRQDIKPTRHIKMSYWVRVASNWDSNSTGKFVGFADLRWKDDKGRSYAHGNRKPVKDGFSFRTWFGKTKNGELPLGMYIYHAGQKKAWGDSIKIGSIKAGHSHVFFQIEADLDAGFVKGRLDNGAWTQHDISVGDETAITLAWLDGYYGGWMKSPFNMAIDIDSYRLDDMSAPEPLPEPSSEPAASARPNPIENVRDNPGDELISSRLRKLADEVESLEQ